MDPFIGIVGLQRGSIGIVENRKETTIGYRLRQGLVLEWNFLLQSRLSKIRYGLLNCFCRVVPAVDKGNFAPLKHPNILWFLNPKPSGVHGL